jgi:hypothetical protein
MRYKFWKSKDKKTVEKEIKEVIELGKIEVTVPKVVGVVAKLRSDLLTLQKNVSDMLDEAARDQNKINELEAILASLLNEGGESAGGVV